MIKLHEIDVSVRYGRYVDHEEELNKFLKENKISDGYVVNVSYKNPYTMVVVYRASSANNLMMKKSE